jgi:putative transposase
VLVARLVELRGQRALSREEVRRAAVALKVTERTVWRWVAAGGYAPPPPRAGPLSPRARELFFTTGGNVKAVHRLLGGEGEPVPSLSALSRAFDRELTPAEVAFARTGPRAPVPAASTFAGSLSIAPTGTPPITRSSRSRFSRPGRGVPRGRG